MTSPTSHVRRRDLLLRVGLPRDLRAVQYVWTFLVATMTTVLVTRALLAATGYPQLGGGGLHIAHVLWGGLLLAIAFLVSVSFVGPAVRPFTALLGGAGFGLFIDEVGKFVTSDNDYFYAPTAALVYLTVVVLALLADVLHGRRPIDPSEALANAVAEASAGVAGGFSRRVRRRAHRALDAGDGLPGAAQTKALLDTIEEDHEELPDPVEAIRTAVQRGLRTIVQARFVPMLAVAVFAVAALAPVGQGLRAWAGESVGLWVLVGVLVSVPASFALVGYGLLRARRDPAAGYQWIRRGVLLGLLVTQVFAFRLSQWGASVGLLIDLVTLGVVSVEADAHRDADRPADVS